MITGIGDGVDVERETDVDGTFSCDSVGVGRLVAEAAVGGRTATVGAGATVGVAIGSAAEQASPTTATANKIKPGNLLFTV